MFVAAITKSDHIDLSLVTTRDALAMPIATGLALAILSGQQPKMTAFGANATGRIMHLHNPPGLGSQLLHVCRSVCFEMREVAD